MDKNNCELALTGKTAIAPLIKWPGGKRTLVRIPVNVTGDSGIVTDIPVNVTGVGVARF